MLRRLLRRPAALLLAAALAPALPACGDDVADPDAGVDVQEGTTIDPDSTSNVEVPAGPADEDGAIDDEAADG